MTTSDATSPQNRLAWLDYAKAIGIVLVVFGHASRSIERTNGLVWSEALQTLDRVIYSFHMPLFFLLAGFAAGLQKEQSGPSFAKSLLWGVAVPYLVWSVIWIGLKVMLPEAANVPLGVSSLATLLWQPVEHFWFLYHLFFIRSGWYFANRWRGGDYWVPVALAIAAIFAAVLLMAVAPDLHWVAGFLRNFAVYGIGLYGLPMLVSRFASGPARNLFVLGIALCLWGAAITMTIGGTLGGIVIAIGGGLAGTGLAKSLPQPVTPTWRTLAFLGEASLAIYVMHLLAGAVVRAVLAKTGLLDESTLLMTATVAGLAIPALAYWGILSLSQYFGRPLTRWAGLGLGTRSSYMTLWGSARPLPSLSAT